MIDISKVKCGAVIRTADLRKRTVDHKDGKYVYFTDGSKYGLRHPDLMEFVEEAEEAVDMHGWTLASLKAYCSENEIPCKGCRTKADYLNAIGVKTNANHIAED